MLNDSKMYYLYGGLGLGLIISAVVSKLFDLSWLAVSIGVLALMIGGLKIGKKI